MSINSEWGLGLWGAIPWGGDLENGPPATPVTESVSDTLTFSDSGFTSQLAVQLLETLGPDTLSFTDSVVTSFVLQVSITDTITFLDNFTPSFTPINLTVFDFFTVSDSQMAAFGFGFTDILSILDSEAATLMAFVDVLSFTDNLFISSLAVITVSDTLSFSDAIALATGIRVSVSDTLTFSDSLAFAVPQNSVPPQNDFIVIVDFLIRFMAYIPSYTDTLVISDSEIIDLGLQVSLSDTINLTDAVTDSVGTGAETEIFSDAVSVSDLITVVVSIVPNETDLLIIDSLAFSDSVQITQIAQLNSYIRKYLNDTVMQ